MKKLTLLIITACGGSSSSLPADAQLSDVGVDSDPLPDAVGCRSISTVVDTCALSPSAPLVFSESGTYDTATFTFTTGTTSSQPPHIVVTTATGELDVMFAAAITIENGVAVRFVGPRPIALVSTDFILLDGAGGLAIDLADGGAGSRTAGCSTEAGDNGADEAGGAGGGGGAGYQGNGGAGGKANSDGAQFTDGGTAGVARARPLAPIGGCAGGAGGAGIGAGGLGGAGGGAILIAAATTLTIRRTIIAEGGPGRGGGLNAGGGGGGAGGMIVLESRDLIGGSDRVNGGGGGGGGDDDGVGGDALPGGIGGSGAVPDGSNGARGNPVTSFDGESGTVINVGGGGGGGGAAGFVGIRAVNQEPPDPQAQQWP